MADDLRGRQVAVLAGGGAEQAESVRPHRPREGAAGMRERADTEEPVTMVSSWRARHGREKEFGHVALDVAAAVGRFPGNLGATVIHHEQSRDFHTVVQFSDRSYLEQWLDSDERARWLAEVGQLAEARTSQQQRTGLETWFQVPTRATATMKPPPRWKMWLVSVLAVYPLVLAFQAFVVPMVSSWPLAAKAALFPLVLLTMMTYVIMPAVTRLLRHWL